MILSPGELDAYIDHAWAAGLFEGEGCFSTHPVNSYRPVVSMALTDLDILQRFQAAVGCGTIGPVSKRQPHHKEIWSWWGNESEFHLVYSLLKPWLGPRRIAQAKSAILVRAEYVAFQTAARSCVICNTSFEPKFSRGASRRKYCSRKCYNCRNNVWFRKQKEALKRAVALPANF